MHASPALYVRGPYRIVANDPDAHAHRLYVVVDSAGAWLHDEPGFDAARDWVDRRVAELDVPARALAPRRIASP